ncbi:MAG: hypothetical protein Q8P25_03950 [Candidatus Curtissbacteria bacterium]|nr:hypothetical protein [Candidatus Curtissbacteria bacterium]
MALERPENSGKNANKSFVNTPILLSDLALFKQAAEQSGYTVKLIAHAGEPYTFDEPVYNGHLKTNKTERKTLIVVPGYIAVCIIKPQVEQDHSPFWGKLTELRVSGIK